MKKMAQILNQVNNNKMKIAMMIYIKIVLIKINELLRILSKTKFSLKGAA